MYVTLNGRIPMPLYHTLLVLHPILSKRDYLPADAEILGGGIPFISYDIGNR